MATCNIKFESLADVSQKKNLRLCDPVPRQLDHGEVSSANCCLNLIEADPEGRRVGGPDVREGRGRARHPVLTSGLAHDHLLRGRQLGTPRD